MVDGPRPIFYDPEGRRARITNFVLGSAAAAVAGGLLALLVAFAAPPLLPPISAAEAVANQSPLIGESAAREPRWKQPLNPMHVRSLPAGAARAKRLAYYGSDDRSFESLKRAAQHLDGILPDWLLIGSSDGDLSAPFPSREKE